MKTRFGRRPALRLAAVLTGLVILFVLLFPALCFALEAHHHCVGEGCRVCACLQQCAVVLHRTGANPNRGTGLLPFAVLSLVGAVLFTLLRRVPLSPVAGKVRLNN